MRLTEYIDYLNNGTKNAKRYSHYTPNYNGIRNLKVRRMSKDTSINKGETTEKQGFDGGLTDGRGKVR
ncbi:MAG: hypothetical protein NZ735_04425 [Candidatus Marinimicrobia bacterium]|nr:hypothetical protein [Candidatus Neomarinimicrobiota bacterium]